MSTLSTTGTQPNARILVWDWPTRIGHWLLAGSFALAWLTAESEALRNIHVGAGYAFAATLLFRLVWGFFGTRHARFSDFVKAPRAAWDYLRSLMTRQPQHWTGHNPAGALAIVGLLLLGLITTVAGFLYFNEIGGELTEELHEGAASVMLGIVVLHILGVAAGSLAHRENLVRAMLTGFKRGPRSEAITSARLVAAVLMLAWVVGAVVMMMRA